MVVLQSMSRFVAESIEERMVSEYPAGRKTPQLCRAIRNNDWSMIEHMLEKHPELVFQRKLPGGWLPFHHALKYTHRVGLITRLLLRTKRRFPHVIDDVLPSGEFPLLIACRANNAVMVEFLVKHGCNITGSRAQDCLKMFNSSPVMRVV